MRRLLEPSLRGIVLRPRSLPARAHPDAERQLSAMMRIRLRLLVTSFNKAVMDYALARLEVALANPGIPAPPVLNRLGPHLRMDQGFAVAWPSALSQVGAAADYVAAVDAGAWRVKRDLPWSRLERAVKLTAQFAESIEWIGVDPRLANPGDEHL